MTIAAANAIESAQVEQIAETSSNPMANIWLGFLAACLGGTLLCTAVLVAWPIVAKLVGGA